MILGPYVKHPSSQFVTGMDNVQTSSTVDPYQELPQVSKIKACLL
jgi:hypothetical protein